MNAPPIISRIPAAKARVGLVASNEAVLALAADLLDGDVPDFGTDADPAWSKSIAADFRRWNERYAKEAGK